MNEQVKKIEEDIESCNKLVETYEKSIEKQRLKNDALTAEIKGLEEKVSDLVKVRDAVLREGREMMEKNKEEQKKLSDLEEKKATTIRKIKRQELLDKQPSFVDTLRQVLPEEIKKLDTGMNFGESNKDPEKVIEYIEKILKDRPFRNALSQPIKEAEIEYSQLIGRLCDSAFNGRKPSPEEQNHRFEIARKLLHHGGLYGMWS